MAEDSAPPPPIRPPPVRRPEHQSTVALSPRSSFRGNPNQGPQMQQALTQGPRQFYDAPSVAPSESSYGNLSLTSAEARITSWNPVFQPSGSVHTEHATLKTHQRRHNARTQNATGHAPNQVQLRHNTMTGTAQYATTITTTGIHNANGARQHGYRANLAHHRTTCDGSTDYGNARNAHPSTRRNTSPANTANMNAHENK